MIGEQAATDPTDRFMRRIQDLEQRLADLERLPRPKVRTYSTVGGAGTTSAGARLVVATLNTPAQPVPGKYILEGSLVVLGTVAGDVFDIELIETTFGALGTFRVTIPPGGWAHGTPIGELNDVAAGATKSFTLGAIRIGAGTGTATTFNDYRYNQIRALFVPS